MAHKNLGHDEAPDRACLPLLQCQDKAEIWQIDLFPKVLFCYPVRQALRYSVHGHEIGGKIEYVQGW